MEAPAFASWPLDWVTAVIAAGRATCGVSLAAAWMKAQPQAAKQRHLRGELLGAVQWAKATVAELGHIRRARHPVAVPGLLEYVVDELLRRLENP